MQVVEVRQRKTFEQNVALVKEYLQTHNRLPNKRDEDPIVRNLGYFVADIRSKYTNTGLNIDQTNIDYVNEQIPGFVWDFKQDAFTKSIDQIRNFYDEH